MSNTVWVVVENWKENDGIGYATAVFDTVEGMENWMELLEENNDPNQVTFSASTAAYNPVP